MKKQIVETNVTDRVPTITSGGFLERKQGEDCLRLPDELERLEDGKFSFTRKWQRPEEEPFDESLYGPPQSQQAH